MKPFPGTYFSYSKALLGIIFLSIGVSLFFSFSYFGSESFSKSNQRTLILIDHSLSMAVEDVKSPLLGGKISRLEQAKIMIRQIGDENGQLGIITYAKNPTLLIPISEVNKSTKNLIESIGPEVDIGGSDLPVALEFAKNLYGKMKLEVLIFTDGGSTSSTPFPEIPRNWRISLYPLGSENGGKIPLGYSANGERRYKYYSGSEVIVSYSPESIKKISNEIGAVLIEDTETSKWIYNNAFIVFFSNNFLYLIAGIFTLFGILFHPYVRRK